MSDQPPLKRSKKEEGDSVISSICKHKIPIDINPVEKEIFEVLLQTRQHFGLSTTLRVAGGWVRDKILKKSSKKVDIDVALDDVMGKDYAEKVNEYLKLKHKETHSIGVIESNPEQSKHLETATMRVAGVWIDLVNLRSETYTEGSRIPTITFGTPSEDAFRRDLTINSLFYNLNEECIEDYTGLGLTDLEAHTIRTPLPPLMTFLDDPLRVLRTIRFASRLGFQMVEEIKEAAKDAKVQDMFAHKVSRERIGSELDGMLSGPDPLRALSLICELQLYHAIFAMPRQAPKCDEDKIVKDSLEITTKIHRFLHFTPARPDTPEEHGDLRRLLFLSSFVFPFSRVRYLDSKKKEQVAMTSIIKESVKFKNKDADDLHILYETQPGFTSQVEELTTSGQFSRKNTGLLMRKAGPLWATACDLAAALALSPTSDPLAPLTEEEVATLATFASFKSRVEAEGLIGVWGLKPILNGKQIGELTGAKGPRVGELCQLVLEWQLEHPDGTCDQCKEWIASVSK